MHMNAASSTEASLARHRAVNPKLQRRFKLIALLLSLLAAFAIGEMFARAGRFVVGPDTSDPFAGPILLYKPDPELAYVPKPNTHIDWPDETGRVISITTDDKGMRLDSSG